MKRNTILTALVLIVVMSGVFLAFYLLYVKYGFKNFWLFYLLLIILMISFALRAQPKEEMLEVEKYHTVTIIKCERCDYREERKFQHGDYIFKQVGTCKKCFGNLYIDDIYVIPPRKK